MVVNNTCAHRIKPGYDLRQDTIIKGVGMKRIKLSSIKELEAFKHHFEQRAGNKVSIEYLNASNVYAYRSGNELKAGYVIHAGTQHRFFDLMQEVGFERIKPLPGEQEDFCEITCMWMEPEVRSYSLRVRFYTSCMLATFAQRKPFVIGGTKTDAVAKRQKYCLPNILFHGDTQNSIGSGRWFIYYGTTWTFVKGFASQFADETRKVIGWSRRGGTEARA